MKQNLGKIDRVLRFLFGVWAISWLLPVIKNTALWWIVLVVAVIALIESFYSYCWLHELFGINNKNQ